MCRAGDVLRGARKTPATVGVLRGAATTESVALYVRRPPRRVDAPRRVDDQVDVLYSSARGSHLDLANLMLGFWPDHPLDLYGPGEAGLPITAYPPDTEVDWVFPNNPTPGLQGMTHALLQAAILVQHAPVFPALAYRFDTPGGSVVFSGDAGPCDNVVRLAQGADILVHEVIDVEFLAQRVAQLPNRDAIISHLSGSHTPAAEAGRIAERAGVKTLVLSHLVPGDDEFTEEEWESRARPHFSGEVVCGVDLDQFSLD